MTTNYLTRRDMEHRLAEAFPANQTEALVGVLDDVREIEVQRAAETRELKAGLRALTQQVSRLVEAQSRTDGHLAELADAQRRTEVALANLGQMVGALVNNFGLQLEEFSAALLPSWLARYHDIEDLTLDRRHVELPTGEVVEVDLMGTGRRSGEPVVVLGECRSRLGGSEARRLADKLDRAASVFAETTVVRLIVAMSIHPSAEDVAGERGVLLVPYSRINRDRGGGSQAQRGPTTPRHERPAPPTRGISGLYAGNPLKLTIVGPGCAGLAVDVHRGLVFGHGLHHDHHHRGW
jgi:hypothetical protein